MPKKNLIKYKDYVYQNKKLIMINKKNKRVNNKNLNKSRNKNSKKSQKKKKSQKSI